MKDLARFLGSRYSDSVTERMQPHKHPYYELNFMTNGRTKMEINGQLFEYSSFDFILIPPNTYHVLNQSASKKFDNYIIWFSATDDGKKQLPQDKIIKLHDYNGIVETLCSEIYLTYKKSKMADQNLISYYLSAVLYHMNKGLMIDIKEKEDNEEPFKKILKYMNRNATYGHVTIAELAELMNYTPTHFSREFKKRFDITPIEYIINLKINESKKLLKETNDSIKEIAEHLGYSDQLYFSKQFSKVVGSSPSDWKKKNLN